MSQMGRTANGGTTGGDRVPLTPSAFLETMAAQLDRLHSATAGLLLRAIPVKTGGTGKVYGGFI